MAKKKAKQAKKERAESRDSNQEALQAEAKKPKLNRKFYEKELQKLQVELVRMQEWVKHAGAKIVVVFEGRDAAGKGGAIKRITERVSPRVFHIVALPAPTEREKSQLYLQRYIPHLPAAGEVMLFDRSWYNRAGVERVMGFCTDEEYEEFMLTCPNLEAAIVRSGIILLKYFFVVSQEEQKRRFLRRIEDPMRQWKLSPMDLESYSRWWDYTEAIDKMINATDTDWAPWYVVKSNDKRRARLNCIAHMLDKIPYEQVAFDEPKLPKQKPRRANVPLMPMFRRFVPEKY